MNLKTPISEIAGIGEAHTVLLARLGIETVEDLLWYLPRRWDDFSNVAKIRDIKPGQLVSVRGKVAQISNRRVKGRLNITEAIVSDGSGLLKVVWFNQPFMTKNIHLDDEIFLAGKLDFSYGTMQMNSPSYEKITDDEEDPTHVGRIVPIYPETAGVTSKWLRSKLRPLMKYIYSIKDYLPESVKKEQEIIDLPAAIRQMHFPENDQQLEKAKERINFDEMFLLQVAVLYSKKNLEKEKAISVTFNEDLIKKFVQSLGFELTVAQRKAAWDILKDLAKGEPMNRLLQGDVGSGKTVVAAIAMLNVAASGAQAALLCPTEILAKQHYAKISEMLLPFEIECVLLTGSTPKEERERVIGRIHEGEAKVVIGTHAILEKKVEFWRLALAIVDEQHRFGVNQRTALRKENVSTGTLPHFLSMTATPIPRTLSLTVYGDLDVSIIYELPAGRQKIITRLIPEDKRVASYGFIRKEVEAGRQVYVVCSLVSPPTSSLTSQIESNKLIGDPERRMDSWVEPVPNSDSVTRNDNLVDAETERKSVMDEYERLSRKVFPDLKVGYIHGQMKTEEKELAMSRFISGEIQIIVSSSVIEVGVDVPNATVMVIENAERFGLSQLHQFRGRVGRGAHQSYCLLFTGSKNEISLKRLNALVETDNGFKLADTDLEIRGPGDFIGGRQHGMPDINMKNLMNLELITKCREAAKRLLAAHEIAEFPLLAEKSSKYNGILNLE